MPPHLPAPSCNIENHHKWQRIKILLVAVFFGLLSGITGASMFFGWIWPGIGGGDALIGSRNISSVSHDSLEDRVRAELDDRVATVYRDLSNVNGVSYLSADKKIGQAVFVSSDGWMVFYYPNFDGSYRNWRVLLKNGSSLPVAKAIKDGNSNLVYFKISPTDVSAQFKVINFVDSLKSQQDVFVLDGNTWRHSIVIDEIANSFHLPHLDSAPSLVAELSDSFSAGNLAVDSQGKLLGVVTSDGYVLPSYYLSGILPTVLSGQKIIYPTLGIYGWFSQEQPILIKNEKISGFIVTRIFSSDNNLRVGDVIEEINGQVADANNLWYNIIGNKTVKLKVWRKDKIIEIVQTIKQI